MSLDTETPPAYDLEAAARAYPRACTAEALRLSFENHLKFSLARDDFSATPCDRYYALALSVRDRLVERWIATSQTYYHRDVKRMYYLSMEYLIGRVMGANVLNLGIARQVEEALAERGLDWEELRDLEHDAGLGNGGLGRLAACFLDSLATLQLPGYGYGLRYDYGIFRQEFRDGWQIEDPDNWLRNGYPWEIERPESQFVVRFGGQVVDQHEERGQYRPLWADAETVIGIPYDVPIPGYGNHTCNNLRLWTAKGSEEFNLTFFNSGDYIRAYENKTLSENITKVLYPNDNIEEGKELRFKQQYFFVSCSLQDIVRRYRTKHRDFHDFADKVAIQLNDTHPSLAVAELMRILMDDHRVAWDEAWTTTVRTFGYTNHTLLPEALETWPVRLFEQYLPRHLQIIYEINRRFLRQVMNKFPHDRDRLRRMSLVNEDGGRAIRMAHLAVVGSHKVNGVAALHSKLLTSTLFRDFHDLWPEKFVNVTNGITFRRWLLKANPGLSRLISSRIGEGWVTDAARLRELEAYADDPEFQAAFGQVKRANKERLAGIIRETLGIGVDPDSLFDTQIKRLHEYKRQLLNVLHILHLYSQIKDDGRTDLVPRTFVFAAKAAPGYQTAKLIVKLINDVAGIVNQDPEVNRFIRVAFLPDYRVSLAERIIPATDLSEQISTAGTEASGTGNMKFALNGALTIGTLDGANVEIREEVGADNFFLFGKRVEEVQELQQGGYDPRALYQQDADLRRVLDYFENGFFDLEQPDLFLPLRQHLLDHGDRYLLCADFRAYLEAQEAVDQAYRDPGRWARMAILNVARIGSFSSDRTIAEYAAKVWGLEPCPIDLPDHAPDDASPHS